MAGVGALFTPFRLGKLVLPNRVVMAPMTRKHSPGGVPGANVAAYYRRRAAGGVGLIITEGVGIPHPAALYDTAIPSFHGKAALAGWSRVLAGVRAEGGRIMPQLWHTGAFRKPGDSPNPEVAPATPSGLFKPGQFVGTPMTQSDIEAVIRAYAEAAASAQRLGFDGIEIHAAHGYLIDTFFWDATNLRSDGYNGDLAARTRFAVEVIAACRAAVGPDFPILLRFSQWKQQDYAARLAPTPAALATFLEPMAAAGVDMLHCSTRRFWEPEFAGSALNLAGWAKKLTGLPTITVGSVGLGADATASFAGARAQVAGLDDHLLPMLERGEFDLVAVGRALLGDPDWTTKIRDGRDHDLRPFDTASMKVLA